MEPFVDCPWIAEDTSVHVAGSRLFVDGVRRDSHVATQESEDVEISDVVANEQQNHRNCLPKNEAISNYVEVSTEIIRPIIAQLKMNFRLCLFVDSNLIVFFLAFHCLFEYEALLSLL